MSEQSDACISSVSRAAGRTQHLQFSLGRVSPGGSSLRPASVCLLHRSMNAVCGVSTAHDRVYRAGHETHGWRYGYVHPDGFEVCHSFKCSVVIYDSARKGKVNASKVNVRMVHHMQDGHTIYSFAWHIRPPTPCDTTLNCRMTDTPPQSESPRHNWQYVVAHCSLTSSTTSVGTCTPPRCAFQRRGSGLRHIILTTVSQICTRYVVKVYDPSATHLHICTASQKTSRSRSRTSATKSL